MDNVVTVYWILILFIIGYPNYIFIKRLKPIKKKRFLHKLFFFIMSLILPSIFICLFMAILISPYIDKLFNLKIDHDTYLVRFIYAIVVFPSGYVTNIYFAKFYLKRISKTKNEIELIGIE